MYTEGQREIVCESDGWVGVGGSVCTQKEVVTH